MNRIISALACIPAFFTDLAYIERRLKTDPPELPIKKPNGSIHSDIDDSIIEPYPAPCVIENIKTKGQTS